MAKIAADDAKANSAEYIRSGSSPATSAILPRIRTSFRLIGGRVGLIGLCFLPAVIVFLPVGLFLLLMSVWVRRAARLSVYALTNQRAIVWQKNLFSMNVQSFGPLQLGRMYRKEKTNGAGDLVFYETTWANSDGNRGTRSVGSLSIAGVHKVEQLVRTTLLAGLT